MNCLCGSDKYTTHKKSGFITNSEGYSDEAKLLIATCEKCKLKRLAEIPFRDEEQYNNFYSQLYPPVHEGYACKSYAGDIASAKKRIAKMGITSDCKKLLDIGCGSGAIVDVCRQRGIEAYGCDLAYYHYSPVSKYIYYKKFEDIHFPTDYFEKIICCDVFEHSLNPIRLINEIFRILAIGGDLIIEIPLFFHKNGAGHWKALEHLWYPTKKYFEKILTDTGFKISKRFKFEETKISYVVTKPEQNRKKLLLPPGVGDVYWPLVKTQSFLEKEGVKGPVDVYVAAPRAKAYNSHARSFPFIEMFPFLHSTGEVKFARRSGMWKEAYLTQGRTIFRDVIDCDYFITWNGYLRAGKTLEEVDPEYECKWDLPRFISLEEDQFKSKCEKEYGDYIVFYFIFTGTNGLILKHFNLDDIANSIKEICEKTKCKPVIVGANWDNDDIDLGKLVKKLPGDAVNLIGETNIEQVFGLMRGSKAVVGMNSGITIMSAVFGVKTIMLIHEYLTTNGVDRSFAWNTLPPKTRGTTYFPEFADMIKPERFIDRAISVINETDFIDKESHRRKFGDIYDFRKVGNRNLSTIRNFDPPTLYDVQCKSGELLDLGELTVACVLKSGGVFDEEYVTNLKNMVKRNTSIEHNFVVLSDYDDMPVKNIRLINNLPDWWSKLELFRLNGPVLYFDLDTVILDDITDLVKSVSRMPEGEVRMLVPFNPARKRAGNWASGVMAWHGDFRFILNNYRYRKNGKGWDQVYIFRSLMNKGIDIKSINEFMPMHSYKRHCTTGVPADAKVICFHGNQKPHNMQHLDIVKRHWK